MAPVTRRKAAQLQAEDPDYQSPAQTGNEAPPSPPPIRRKRKTKTPKQSSQSGEDGLPKSNVKKSRPLKQKRKKSPAEKQKKSGDTKRLASVEKDSIKSSITDIAVQGATSLDPYARNNLSTTSIPGLTIESSVVLPGILKESKEKPPIIDNKVEGEKAIEVKEDGPVVTLMDTKSDPEKVLQDAKVDKVKDTGTSQLEVENAKVLDLTELNENAEIGTFAAIHVRPRDVIPVMEPEPANSPNSTDKVSAESTEQTQESSDNNENFAFDRAELQTCGALEIANAALPTLDTYIHDIWDRARYDHWKFDSQLRHNTDWRIYEAFCPALRLASLWLTRPEYQPFWTSLMCGEYELDENQQSWKISATPIEMTAKRTKDMENKLRDLARKLRFCFHNLDISQGQWAATQAMQVEESESYGAGIFAPRLMTTFHDDFMYVLWPGANPPVWDTSSTSKKLRFLFFFAVQLGRELANALWIERCRQEHGDEGLERFPQISIHGKQIGPMDAAFERFMFGGKIEVINGSSSPRCWDGLAVRYDDGLDDSNLRVAALSMEAINNRFSSAWWADEANAAGRQPGKLETLSTRAGVARTNQNTVI